MTGRAFSDLRLGESDAFTKTITESDVVLFAGITGDFNPVHIDRVAAEASPFKGRVAHGMLTASLISTVLGARLPGPGAMYLSQSLRFRKPVYIGDTITARVEIVELIPQKQRVRLATQCVNERGELVAEGESLVQIPEQPVRTAVAAGAQPYRSTP
jgi:3-hydroxybutyryl-CoA dehydratase